MGEKIDDISGSGSFPVRLREAALPGSSEINIPTPMPGKSPHYRRNNIMIRKETLITRRRQYCQDMSRMAWPDEALAARDEIIAIDEAIRP